MNMPHISKIYIFIHIICFLISSRLFADDLTNLSLDIYEAPKGTQIIFQVIDDRSNFSQGLIYPVDQAWIELPGLL